MLKREPRPGRGFHRMCAAVISRGQAVDESLPSFTTVIAAVHAVDFHPGPDATRDIRVRPRARKAGKK